MEAEQISRVLGACQGTVDSTELTLFQMEILLRLSRKQPLEARQGWNAYLSDAVCRWFLQERKLIEGGLIEVTRKNRLRLTGKGHMAVAGLVMYQREMVELLLDPAAAAEAALAAIKARVPPY